MIGTVRFIFTHPVLRYMISHRIITRLAEGFVTGFGAIFIYTVSGEQLWVPMTVYTVAALGSALAMFWIDRVFNVLGTKTSIVTGVVLRIGLWVCLVLTTAGSWMYTLPLYALCIIGIRFFYWPPYNNILTNGLDDTHRTQGLAFLSNVASGIGLFMPVVVGIIVSLYSFNLAFILGTILICLSLIPVLKIPATKSVRYDWRAGDLWKHVRSKENRHYVWGLAAQGFENAFAGALWPIVIFILLDGDFVSIGIIASLAGLGVIMLNTVTSRFADQMQNSALFLRYSTVIKSIIWVLKAFAETAMQVFFLRTFSSASSSVVTINQESVSFAQAQKHQDLADEYVVLRDFSLNMGRVIGYTAIIISSLFVPIQWLFALAAIAVLCINIITIPQKNK